MAFTLDALHGRLRELPKVSRYLVAFSGGLDSSVLLHALHRLGPERSGGLSAIHLDHGLSDASASWSEHCERFCRDRDIKFELQRLNLEPKLGESLEAEARHARYTALKALSVPGEAIVTAHHADDQAETLLLHLMRGSGIDGLAAMPAWRNIGEGVLIRPLLGFKRKELEVFARSEGLHWIEDHSNQDLRFDRNYMRHRVMPVLRARWPAVISTLSRSADHCAEASILIRRTYGHGEDSDGTQSWLEVCELSRLSPAVRKVRIREWLRDLGLPLPGNRRIEELLRQALEASRDRVPLVEWPGAEVRRWRSRLYAHAPLPKLDMKDRVIPWVEPDSLLLPANLGRLTWSGGEMPKDLEVRIGPTAAECVEDNGHKKLRAILYDAAVPSWLRDRVPCVFEQDRLIAVADIHRCAGWPSSSRVQWQKGAGWPIV